MSKSGFRKKIDRYYGWCMIAIIIGTPLVWFFDIDVKEGAPQLIFTVFICWMIWILGASYGIEKVETERFEEEKLRLEE